MDLSQFSTDDLKAMQSGDLAKVSTQGLLLMHAQAHADARPLANSTPAIHAQAADKVANDAISQDAKPSFLGEIGDQIGNLVAGGVRGAGSIGATVLAPVDAAARAVNGGKPISIGGYDLAGQDRRAGMDAGLATLGADASSPAYKVGKITAEIAGTAGAGGAVANVVGRAAPVVAAAAPNLLNAVRTAGMSGGNMLTRAAGGAINGAASAGLVDPSQAGAGAVVGGALPIVVKGAGMAGNALGELLGGPQQTPELAAAIQAARDKGYVIPPTQANPTLANRLLEGLAGKISIAQSASARNAGVTNSLAAQDIGLPAATTITPEALDAVRAKAGEAYAAVAGAGKFNAAGADLPKSAGVVNDYNKLTISPQSTVDASDLVNAWKKANADAGDYFKAYGRSAHPDDKEAANAAAANANAIHDFLTTQMGALEGKTSDQLLNEVAAGRLSIADFVKQTLSANSRAAGAPGAVDALDAARTRIAKTYNVENAMNGATGTVDARKLAKSDYLTGGLKDAADFASRFPKAAQTPEAMGSLPGVSPLDWATSAITPSKLISLLSLGTRPAARSLALSPFIQNRLIQNQGPNALAELLGNPRLAALGYRSAPTSADR